MKRKQLYIKPQLQTEMSKQLPIFIPSDKEIHCFNLMCFLKVYAEKIIDKILSTLLRQTNQII